MNGEHYWTKECSVAYIRNQGSFRFHDLVGIEHPVDCISGLGATMAYGAEPLPA